MAAEKFEGSKTEDQEVIERMELQGENVIKDESLPSATEKAVDFLPKDTTPRFDIHTINLTGNSLFNADQLLADMPGVFNTARDGALEAGNLYDMRQIKALVENPGTAQSISARSIQGLTLYILSVYQKKHYAGIYVYVPVEAFDEGKALSQGILPVNILEAPVTIIDSNYYTVKNEPSEEPILKVEALEGWSPVKMGKIINRKQLDDYLNLLNLNPDRYVSAMVSRGAEPNSLGVTYNVYEANPWHFFLQIDNSGTDDIKWTPRIGLINTNLLGYDDKFTAVFQATPDSTWNEEYAIFGRYDFPILGPKLRLELFGGHNAYDIADADIHFLGSGTFAGGKLRYNLLQHKGWFFDLTASLIHETSAVRNSLFAELGLPEADIHMTTWGAGAQLYKRDDMSDTSLYFDVFGSLNTSSQSEMNTARTGADTSFMIYNLIGRHSRYLDANKIQRLTGTFKYINSDGRLVPAKMTSFGGMYSVRGYKEYEVVADGGFLASLQYEYDLVRAEQIKLLGQDTEPGQRKPFLKKLAPLVFFDYGHARNKEPLTGSEHETQELASIGCGAIIELGDNFTGTIYYGYPLVGTERTDVGDGRVNIGLLVRW